MKVSRFEDLLVWKKSRELAGAVYRVSNDERFRRDFGLRDQIRRAAVSVMSNIAEGFGRYSRHEFRHFVSIARGSAAEAQSQVYLAHDLNYISDEAASSLLSLCIEISKMLAVLHTRLQNSP